MDLADLRKVGIEAEAVTAEKDQFSFYQVSRDALSSIAGFLHALLLLNDLHSGCFP